MCSVRPEYDPTSDFQQYPEVGTVAPCSQVMKGHQLTLGDLPRLHSRKVADLEPTPQARDFTSCDSLPYQLHHTQTKLAVRYRVKEKRKEKNTEKEKSPEGTI